MNVRRSKVNTKCIWFWRGQNREESPYIAWRYLRFYQHSALALRFRKYSTRSNKGKDQAQKKKTSNTSGMLLAGHLYNSKLIIATIYTQEKRCLTIIANLPGNFRGIWESYTFSCLYWSANDNSRWTMSTSLGNATISISWIRTGFARSKFIQTSKEFWAPFQSSELPW